MKEEGIGAFWRGAGPFVSRAALVGACQVQTLNPKPQTPNPKACVQHSETIFLKWVEIFRRYIFKSQSEP
jgi:hypothetical protein